ncbi:MAG: ABC transporter substrate-binding protein, partial [Pseudonocardia sp.]
MRIIVVVLGLLAATVACGGEPPGPERDSSGRPTIRFATGFANIGTLDPITTVSGYDRMITYMLFDGLVRYRQGDVTAPFEPDLATEVPQGELTPDGHQTWTLPIRSGVICPAGPASPRYELTADDVVYSLSRAADPAKSNFSTYYSNVTAIEKLDDHTVRLTVDTPMTQALFLPLVSDWGPAQITCRKAVEAQGDQGFANFPIGTGPFTFQEYVPGQVLHLVANDDYWQGRPKAAGWDIQPMADDTARKLALLGGDLDVAAGGDTDAWFSDIAADDRFTLSSTPILGNTWMTINTSIPPLDDVRVRKAICYVLDRAAWLNTGAGKTLIDDEHISRPTLAFVSSAVMPAGLPDEEVTRHGLDYPHDLDEARRLMAEAGHADGFTIQM